MDKQDFRFRLAASGFFDGAQLAPLQERLPYTEQLRYERWCDQYGDGDPFGFVYNAFIDTFTDELVFVRIVASFDEDSIPDADIGGEAEQERLETAVRELVGDDFEDGVRFDLVRVNVLGGKNASVCHVRGAFEHDPRKNAQQADTRDACDPCMDLDALHKQVASALIPRDAVLYECDEDAPLDDDGFRLGFICNGSEMYFVFETCRPVGGGPSIDHMEREFVAHCSELARPDLTLAAVLVAAYDPSAGEVTLTKFER